MTNALQMRVTAVGAGSLANLPSAENLRHEFERDAVPVMRSMAMHGFTPRATAKLLAARYSVDVGSFYEASWYCEYLDAETPTSGYRYGAFDVSRSGRRCSDAWRLGQDLLSRAVLG